MKKGGEGSSLRVSLYGVLGGGGAAPENLDDDGF